MKKITGVTRRQLVQGSLGLVAFSAAGSLLAQVTPEQTEGPFFPIHEQPDKDADMTRVAGRSGRATGQVIEVSGRVLDESGQPVAGALIDVWQANAHGRYDHEADPNPAPLDENFQGWAQLRSDVNGRYRFRSIKPGAYAVMDEWSRPPHIHFKVARRGYHELTTQMYFAGDPLNDSDRVLQAVPEAERGMLIVEFSKRADLQAGVFDLILRTV